MDPRAGTHTQTTEPFWHACKMQNKWQCSTHRPLLDSYLCEFAWRQRCRKADFFVQITDNVCLLSKTCYKCFTSSFWVAGLNWKRSVKANALQPGLLPAVYVLRWPTHFFHFNPIVWCPRGSLDRRSNLCRLKPTVSTLRLVGYIVVYAYNWLPIGWLVASWQMFQLGCWQKRPRNN